jgi:hypothetical protein
MFSPTLGTGKLKHHGTMETRRRINTSLVSIEMLHRVLLRRNELQPAHLTTARLAAAGQRGIIKRHDQETKTPRPRAVIGITIARLGGLSGSLGRSKGRPEVALNILCGQFVSRLGLAYVYGWSRMLDASLIWKTTTCMGNPCCNKGC